MQEYFGFEEAKHGQCTGSTFLAPKFNYIFRIIRGW